MSFEKEIHDLMILFRDELGGTLAQVGPNSKKIMFFLGHKLQIFVAEGAENFEKLKF